MGGDDEAEGDADIPSAEEASVQLTPRWPRGWKKPVRFADEGPPPHAGSFVEDAEPEETTSPAEHSENGFRSAVQSVLECLAREHERVLAAREASLRLELARLRGELTARSTPSKESSNVDLVLKPQPALYELAKNRPATPLASCLATKQEFESVGGKHLQFHESTASGDTAQVPSSRFSAASAKQEAELVGGKHLHFPDRRASGDIAQVSSDDLVGVTSSSHRSLTSYKNLHFARILSQQSMEREPTPVVTRNKTARAVIHQAENYMNTSISTSTPEKLVPLLAVVRDHVTSWVWESIMGCVIILNTMTLGVSSELYPSWDGWFYIDVCFAAVFTVELAVKLSCLGCKKSAWQVAWKWTVFEAVLVVLAWLEVSWEVGDSQSADVAATSKSSLVRTLRLLRLAKLLRVFRLSVFCELLMMVNGASGSYKTLLYSALLVCIPLYSISLVMKETLSTMSSQRNGAEFFTHLDEAFFTLFRCFVGGDCTQQDGSPLFVLLTMHYGWAYGLLYCGMQFLMTFGLFNVISAIYVENTVSAAKYNELALKRQRLHDRDNFQENAERLLRLIWYRYQSLSPEQLQLYKLKSLEELKLMSDRELAGKLELTREFFEDLCKQKSFQDILRDLDISDDDQYDLFKTLDPEGRCSITLMQLITGIDKLRGSARKADLVYCALQLQSLQQQVQAMMQQQQQQQQQQHQPEKPHRRH